LFCRKVRCPGCREIFRITEAVIVDFPGEDHGVIEWSIDGSALGNEKKQEETDSYGTDDGCQEGRAQQSEQLVCSRCGFTLSCSFIRVIDSLPVCAACAG
jgi:hypothetical protein